MDKVGEIISRVERRRKWTAERKAKILTEALEPGPHTIVIIGSNRRGGTAKQPISIVVPK